MILVITGTPGTGKTEIAKELSKKLGFKVINEKEFALTHKLGKLNKEKEIEIDVKKMQKKLLISLKKEKNQVIEGHLLCEMKIPANLCVVLHANSSILEKRMKKRGYSDEKILDNIFCEETDYCLKKASKNYVYITNIDSSGKIEVPVKKILSELKKLN
ncbi:MAG: AAA family ATPase [Candidatus Diapherotrites archaeon]|nr:AAA family ATPase [Candidatus Diapherotrites archaeon]